MIKLSPELLSRMDTIKLDKELKLFLCTLNPLQVELNQLLNFPHIVLTGTRMMILKNYHFQKKI